MLQVKDNTVKIEGILSEIDLKYITYQTNKNAISGTLKIRVDQKVGEEIHPLEIPVSIFAAELKTNGDRNPVYSSTKEIMDSWNSIAAVGEEKADCVRITSGRLDMNEYCGRNGQIVSFPRVSTAFVNKINRDTCKHKAEFSAIFAVGQKGYKVDKDGVETDTYAIKGILPRYNGQVDIFEFIAANENVINAISTYWNDGDTVRASGRLNFTSRVETTYVPVDFGEPVEQTRTINVSELIITGGSSTPLDEDAAYAFDEIQMALNDRQERLSRMKENVQNQNGRSQAAPKANANFKNFGF